MWVDRQRVASVLSHEAMHNVFSLIEPSFLTLKQPSQTLTCENSLGMDTYRSLLRLGFWKKLVYVMQAETSLNLCFQFVSREHF